MLGEFVVRLGAVPVGRRNLTVGMLSVIPVLALGCVFFLFGSKHLQDDQTRAQHASGGGPIDALQEL